MPYFTMCDNRECPYRTRCRRNPASGTKPSPVQSWAAFSLGGSPTDPKTCEGWWPKYFTLDGAE